MSGFEDLDIEFKKKESSLTNEEKEVLVYLKSFNWPKGSIRYLPSAIRASLRNYKKFLKRFHEVLKESEQKYFEGTKDGEFNDLHEFIHFTLKDSFFEPDTHVIIWFEDFNKKVHKWKNWNGRIRPFNANSEEFKQYITELAYAWAGSAGASIVPKFFDLIGDI